MLEPNCLRQCGVRIAKFPFIEGTDRYTSNDFPIFRYADVLLMKAEALWKTGQDAQALALVNQIRARAGVPDLTTLDGPVSYDKNGPPIDGGELFNEIGREMFAEHHRRQDLIRFGLYNELEKWILPYYNPGDVVKKGDYLLIFPIHKDKIAANPNLDQNPGY